MTALLRRRALLAGLAVAAVAFLVLRRRGGGGETGALLAPAPGVAPEQTLDAGAPAEGNLLPAIYDLTSYTALLETRLAGLETMNESVLGRLDDLIDDRIVQSTPPPAAAPAPAWTPPPAREELIARSLAANPHAASLGPLPGTVDFSSTWGLGAATPPPRSVTVQGASGQQPAPAPGNARVAAAAPAPAPAREPVGAPTPGRHVAA